MPRSRRMIVPIHNRCSDFNSYVAAHVKSLFNCESGCDFKSQAELPIESNEWKIAWHRQEFVA